MAAAIRIKLIDLLQILSDRPPVARESHAEHLQLFASAPATVKKTECSLLIEQDLEAIKRYLQASKMATKRDLSMELNMSDNATLYRLNLLKERGIVVDLPGHNYGLKEAAQ